MKTFDNEIIEGQIYKDVKSGKLYKVVNIIFTPAIKIPRKWCDRAIIKKTQLIDSMVFHVYIVDVAYSGSYSSTIIPCWPDGGEIIDVERFDPPIRSMDLSKKSRIYRRGLNIVDKNGSIRAGFHAKLVLCQ